MLEYLRRHLLLLVLIYILLFIAAVEIALRLIWHNPYLHESPDRLVRLRINHELSDHLVDRSAYLEKDTIARFRTDQRGYIVPSVQYKEPEVSIVFFGGSTTAIENVKENLRFPHLVSELLAEKGIRANCANIAKSGNSLHDSLNILINHVIFDKPDIVVVMHAINDIGILRAAGNYTPRAGFVVDSTKIAGWSAQMASSYSQFVGIIRWIITSNQIKAVARLRTKELQKKKENNQKNAPEKPFIDTLRGFISVARSYGITPVIMTQPLASSEHPLRPEWSSPSNQDRFNRIIRRIASETESELIDLVEFLQNEVPDWDRERVVFVDGMHVTDYGSRKYAEKIARTLAPLVQRIREQKAVRVKKSE